MREKRTKPKPFDEWLKQDPLPLPSFFKMLNRRTSKLWRWTQRFEWSCEWLVYFLSRWAFLEVLEYVGKLGLVVTAFVWLFSFQQRERAATDQRKSKQFQAWQALSLAEGKPGDWGRRFALEDLNSDGLEIQDIQMPLAQLEKVQLPGISMDSVDLSSANLAEANLANSVLYIYATNASFREANLSNFKGRINAPEGEFRHANFRSAFFDACDFTEANFEGATLDKAEVTFSILARTLFDGASFKGTILSYGNFESASFKGADLTGAKFYAVTFVELILQR